MVGTEELLPQAVLRQIGDKLYEKRKVAALEVEQIIKRLASANDDARIRLIVDRLISEFAFSQQPNHRKVSASLRLTLRWHPGEACFHQRHVCIG
jgi:vacuole morphology and inheritance protein 14